MTLENLISGAVRWGAGQPPIGLRKVLVLLKSEAENAGRVGIAQDRSPRVSFAAIATVLRIQFT